MSPESTEPVPAKNITVPLFVFVTFIVMVAGAFVALSTFAATQFWDNQISQLKSDLLEPIELELNKLNARLEDFENEATRGRFGETHYGVARSYFNKNKKLPEYSWLHNEAKRINQSEK